MPRSQFKRAFALMLFSLLPAVLAVFVAGPAFSQAPFFQGKTITLIVGAGPGGMGDLRAKALASSAAIERLERLERRSVLNR